MDTYPDVRRLHRAGEVRASFCELPSGGYRVRREERDDTQYCGYAYVIPPPPVPPSNQRGSRGRAVREETHSSSSATKVTPSVGFLGFPPAQP
jgi:hypothetical protein